MSNILLELYYATFLALAPPPPCKAGHLARSPLRPCLLAQCSASLICLWLLWWSDPTHQLEKENLSALNSTTILKDMIIPVLLMNNISEQLQNGLRKHIEIFLFCKIKIGIYTYLRYTHDKDVHMFISTRKNSHFSHATLFQGSSWSLNFQKDQFDPSTFLF